MTVKNLKQVFPVYANMIAGETGVRVEIGGSDAYFDFSTRTIHLPALPLDNPELAESAWGYQYHEAFHASDSDVSVLRHVAGKPLRKKLLNIFEDLWVEREQPKRYLTAKGAIDAMNTLIMNSGGFNPAQPHDPPPTVLANYILLQGIAYHNNLPALQPSADIAGVTLRSVFPQGVVTRLNALMDKYVPLIASTADSLALTDSIITMLEEEEEKETSEQSQPDQSPPDGGDHSDGDDGPEQPSGHSSDDSAGDTEQSAMQRAINAVEGDLPEDKSATIENRLESNATSDYRVAAPVPLGLFSENPDRGLSCYKNALAASGAARKHLQRLLQDVTSKGAKLKDFGSRIDQSRMQQAMFGDSKVFIHRGSKSQKNTDFHLLLDGSGSMSRRYDAAIEATIAMALALERLRGVSLGVSRFPVRGESGGISYADGVQPLLLPGERVAVNMDRFNIDTMGSTPLAEALWQSYIQLLQQDNPRKILIVVTDGAPNDKDAVHDVYEWSKSVGITTVGIGIEEPCVTELFDVAETINDVSELSSALMNLTRSALLSAA